MKKLIFPLQQLRIQQIILAILLTLPTACTPNLDKQKFFNPAKYHHTPEGFRNPAGSPVRVSRPFRFIGFIFKRLTKRFDQNSLPDGHILSKLKVKNLFSTAPKNARITWIGHATFLIGLDGLNILTDPHFSDRASPVSFLGPKRYAPPALNVAELPKIDVILVSHNHYDSLDEGSMRQLANHSPNALVLIPLGNANLLREWGMSNVQELDWYDKYKVGNVTFQSTPAIHRSNRGILDVNQSLWSGFLITGKIDHAEKKIWFAGDTGFGPVFKKEVNKKIGPVDIAIIPIGAFLPRDIMKAVHVTPEEGLLIAKIMGAKLAIPMHWGTFPISEDSPKLGKRRFLQASYPSVGKVVMKIGETLDLRKF